MPCDWKKVTDDQAAEEKARQDLLKALEKQLLDQSARFVKTSGGLRIEGWKDRGGWCDACAVRTLALSGDARVRAMVAKAQSGVVSVGHSHPHGHSHGHSH